MRIDGGDQIASPAVVQEEQALAKTPQWRGAELCARRSALAYAISGADVVHEEIREEVGCLEPERCSRMVPGGHGLDVAHRAARLVERCLALLDLGAGDVRGDAAGDE